MVLTPQQRDALLMVRPLLASVDRLVGRAYDNGSGEELGEAMRIAVRVSDTIANVVAGGQGPELAPPPQAQGQALAATTDVDRIIAALIAASKAGQVGDAC